MPDHGGTQIFRVERRVSVPLPGVSKNRRFEKLMTLVLLYQFTISPAHFKDKENKLYSV